MPSVIISLRKNVADFISKLFADAGVSTISFGLPDDVPICVAMDPEHEDRLLIASPSAARRRAGREAQEQGYEAGAGNDKGGAVPPQARRTL